MEHAIKESNRGRFVGVGFRKLNSYFPYTSFIRAFQVRKYARNISYCQQGL